MANTIRQFVTEIARKQNIHNFIVDVGETCMAQGSGSSIFRAQVKYGEAVELDVAVKQAPTTMQYANEEAFYQKTLPKLLEFQQSHQVTHKLPVPEFYGAHTEGSMKMLAMENLCSKGFEPTRRVTAIADENHVVQVLKALGKIHGATLTYMTQHPDPDMHQNKDLYQLVEEEVAQCQDPRKMPRPELVARMVCAQVWSAAKGRTPSNEDQYQKDMIASPEFKACQEVIEKVRSYSGRHYCLIHGSTLMSNMMFRYNDGDVPEEIRFVDWKRNTVSTPVYDISYFLYSSAPNALLREKSMESLLKEYYGSFSEAIKEHGHDAQSIMPYETFQSDWKRYHHAGLINSIIVLTNFITTGKDLIQDLKKQVKEEENISDYILTPIEYEHADRIQRMEEILYNVSK